MGTQLKGHKRQRENIIILTKTFVYCVQNSLIIMLLSLIMGLWHLSLYTSPYIWYNFPKIKVFFGSGTQTNIVLLMFSAISAYVKITSEAMKIIWDVYLLLFACPGLSCYFWGFINNRTQPCGRKVGNDFSQTFTSFSPFRSDTSPFESVQFPLDVKDAIFLLLILVCLLCTVYNTFRIRLRFPWRLPRDLPQWWKILSGMGCEGNGPDFEEIFCPNSLEVLP